MQFVVVVNLPRRRVKSKASKYEEMGVCIWNYGWNGDGDGDGDGDGRWGAVARWRSTLNETKLNARTVAERERERERERN
jgi:hypothetical protein